MEHIEENRKKEHMIQRMKSQFFSFLAEMPKNEPYAEMVERFLFLLKDFLDSSYLSIYRYSYVSNDYLLIAKTDDSVEEHPGIFLKNQKQIHDALNEQPFGKFENHNLFKHAYLIKLDYFGESSYLFIGSHDRQLEGSFLRILQVETENMFNILRSYFSYRNNYTKSKHLVEIAKKFYSSSDRDSILYELVQTLKEVYPCFSFQLLLSYDYNNSIDLPIQTLSYSNTKQASARAYTSGEVQFESKNRKTKQLYAPLLGTQGVYGVIQVKGEGDHVFLDEEVEFITKIAKLSGQAIEKHTLYEHSIHLVSDLRFLNEITKKLNSRIKFSELVRIIKREIIKISQANEIAFVYYHESMEKNYDILKQSSEYFLTDEGKYFLRFLAKDGKIEDSIFSSNYRQYQKNFPYRSVIVVPMIESGETYGFVVVMHREESFFSFENFKLIQSLISHSTLALTNAVLREKLEKAVITDYLTKLYSRSHLDEMLKQHLKSGQRGTLILIDIDDFKEINDTHGHYIGDEVIIQVANIIQKNIGKKDIPARWGGEEFAIYLPEKSLAEGVRMIEEIRKQVMENTDPQVTFSCGISTWNISKVESVSDIFIRADKALYRAKNKGKNCIITEPVI